MAGKRLRKQDLKADYFRVSLTLPKELDDYLESLGSEAKSSGGFKLPKTSIVRAFIRAIMDLEIDLTGVKEEEQLQSRITAAMKKLK
ncbi:MAG: hypothetical protein ACLFP1_09335 [Candidatus Goldiibacteriota bacterium]